MSPKKEFEIPSVEFPNGDQITEAVLKIQQTLLAEANRKADSEKLEKALTEIATQAWRARSKMIDSSTGEAREEMKRVFRHVESILEKLREIGLELKDHTVDVFDYGLPLKVIATQPQPDITRENVIETIKPTIYWQDRIVQMGEVVIATPEPSTPAE